MKRSINLWQFFGFGVTSLLGTLLHFLYDFSGNSPLAAPFSGVNESTFEHMKLLFWPMLLFAAVQYFFFRDRPEFFGIKLRGILLGLVLIPLIFYAYNGIIGKSPDWFNVTIFFISAAIAYLYEVRLFNKNEPPIMKKELALGLLALIAALFVIFTFKAPALNIFRDPLTGSYGI